MALVVGIGIGVIKKYSILLKKKHQDILDIGCGEGITLEKLVNKYKDKNILGVDVIVENVDICKKYNLPVVLGDVYGLKIKEESIDLCILSEVIEHLDNVGLALENIKRILRPGGDLIIVFPNDTFFKIARILFLKFKEAFADYGHINHFSPWSIEKILSRAGFEIIKIKNTPFGFWILSLHCLVLARKK
ncbi:MAG: class I SAM-dependent methyltransferase [Candidatus Portnoybacteria bacterium]|nr:class I SAM-dependent methyltransferase [Candidatus Portnoybacteria bacterium]